MIHGRIEATGSPEIVFQNQALLEKARLVQPIVLSTYAGLRERGVIPAGCPIPRTTQQLTDLVAASFQAGTGADPS